MNITPLEPPTLLLALSLGFLGSTHCIGMCGGISAALSLNQTSPSKLRQLIFLLSFNLGRVSSYVLAAVLVGYIGQLLGNYHQNMALGLRILAGILLILMGLYVAGINQWLVALERKGQLLWRYIQPATQKLIPAKNIPTALLLGALWGWLPCGLVYSSLGWTSLNSQSWWQASLLMLCFGLGTVPVMLATGLAAQRLQQFLQNKNIRRLLGLMIIAFGIWTVVGILPHAGGHHHHHGNHNMPGMDHSTMDHSTHDDHSGNDVKSNNNSKENELKSNSAHQHHQH